MSEAPSTPRIVALLTGGYLVLGLPICHSIVTAHGGTIEATSVPGDGTTFRIEFPAFPGGDPPPPL